MPRLPPSLTRRAYHLDPLLPRLLWECRDLDSARNELRWLREHASSVAPASSNGTSAAGWRSRLKEMVNQRSKGRPLQYILGDQPFGNLDILCRKGVLIPRPETESYTTRTARWILSYFHNRTQSHSPLRILDLCTGTGCIPLLLHSLLAPSIPNLQIFGIDISNPAIALAKRNLTHNITRGNLCARAAHEVQFIQADILHDENSGTADQHDHQKPQDDIRSPSIRWPRTHVPSSLLSETWDVVISNPPYISPVAYRNGTTKRSVRLHEPKLALVSPPPPAAPHSQTSPLSPSAGAAPAPAEVSAHAQQDSFYAPLLRLSARVKGRLTVLECGDVEQARRVVSLAEGFGWGDGAKGSGLRTRVGIWRCDGLEDVSVPYCTEAEVGEGDGDGNDDGARAVVVIREDGCSGYTSRGG